MRGTACRNTDEFPGLGAAALIGRFFADFGKRLVEEVSETRPPIEGHRAANWRIKPTFFPTSNLASTVSK
jgi:hypothetical protein